MSVRRFRYADLLSLRVALRQGGFALTMMCFPARDTGSGDGKGGRGLPGAISEALRREAAAELDMVVGGKNGWYILCGEIRPGLLLSVRCSNLIIYDIHEFK